VPSYYESFGRIAVESMINGIPVLYSKPAKKSIYPGGSTEGMQEWIGDAAISCEREDYTEWMDAIARFDDSTFYSEFTDHAKDHIDKMNLFTEASRIAEMVETFAREHPVAIRSTQQQQAQKQQTAFPLAPKEPRGPVGFGFSNGRLRIQR
jgi:hypothetical protein